MVLNKANIWIESGWFEMNRVEDNLFEFENNVVKITNDGKVLVLGGSQGTYALKLIMNNAFGEDFLVLGDAWERGYGDLKWEKPEGSKQLPWYFMMHKDNRNCGYGVKTLPNSMCFWQCDEKEIALNIDIRCGSQSLVLDGRELLACEIVSKEYEGEAYEAMCLFCELMCDEIRRVDDHIYGGNDWYCNYGDNSFEKILLHTKRIVECAKGCSYTPYMLVDDGWEISYNPGDDKYPNYNGGPWKSCNTKFGDMRKMAEAIKAEGAIPGIWMRPLETTEYVPSDCVLRKDYVKKILDPSHPTVLEMVKEDIKTLKDWGYKLIKHDFSTYDIWHKWGFEVMDLFGLDDIYFYDKTKTTAEIIKQFYLAIREAAGDDVIVMGCNTISHLSAGIFEMMRTGDDTSGFNWERTKKYGVNTLAFRMPQHNRFYLADADCVGITKKIEWNINKQWLDVLAKSGTPLFVSIAEDAYTDEVRDDISAAFKNNCKAAENSKPLDWMEVDKPSRWKSAYGVDEYQW